MKTVDGVVQPSGLLPGDEKYFNQVKDRLNTYH